MTPERSVTVSPVAASRSGVPTRTAAARKPPTMGSTSVTRRSPAPGRPRARAPRIRVGEQDDDDDHRFHDIYRDGRHSRIPLHGARPGFERAEENSRRDDAERIEPGQQRHGNGGESIAGREVLKERVGHAADLDTAREAGDRPESSSATAPILRASTPPLISAARGPVPTARAEIPTACA